MCLNVPTGGYFGTRLDFSVTLFDLLDQTPVSLPRLPQDKQMLLPPISLQCRHYLFRRAFVTLVVAQLHQLLRVSFSGEDRIDNSLSPFAHPSR
jgi:hypothetical protein